MQSPRYICIHGHFYQPPRENPWLEAIERQDSAYPYHDWNERITAECYAANSRARILNDRNEIVRIVSNYSRISFNFGPTLLAWLEEHEPETYAAILAADRESQIRFAGHGSAIAQTYNHTILPLSNRRDKVTQVLWGIRDFARRFGRRPEGMWLPEAAVDVETLEILAEHGITYTILAQRQADRVRRIGDNEWRSVRGAHIDPTMPYVAHLPSGRSITIFFYDGPISQALAFDKLLERGENLFYRLADAFSPTREWAQLVHIATDGETYGHHHRGGEQALAYALDAIESSTVARLTNYGEFIELQPPTHEVEILENTSWSCAHGVDRWRRDCGCNGGSGLGWNQSWREPLRNALDWLRDQLAGVFETESASLFVDPWAARDDYITVILDRSPANVAAFFLQHCRRQLKPDEAILAIKLLEMQRQTQLMYTSCGWFFDDISGLETVQVIQYASRAIQLVADIVATNFELEFARRLEEARSNVPQHRDGRVVFETLVRPVVIDLPTVGAHYAISSLFENYGDRTQIYCYTIDREVHQVLAAGRAKLAFGQVKVESDITGESESFAFGVIHLGDHNLNGGIRLFRSERAYKLLASKLSSTFMRGDVADVIRLMDKEFGGGTYSLRRLFRDEQRRVLDRILESTLGEAESAFRQLYDHHAPLMRFLSGIDAPVPEGLHQSAQFSLNRAIRRALESEELESQQIKLILSEAMTTGVTLDTPGLAFTLQKSIENRTEHWRSSPTDLDALERVVTAAELADSLPFGASVWRLQNVYYDLSRTVFAQQMHEANRGIEAAQAWLALYMPLGARIGVALPAVDREEAEQETPTVSEPDPEVVALVQQSISNRRTPRAIYRLQFSPSFTFADATAITAYLDDLGISDCHSSPVLLPRLGSSHGYDVSDHSKINPALGGEDGLNALSDTLSHRRMGLILDIVPNHMGIGDPANRWWMDVLENGPSSIYADYFDIDWQPSRRDLENKVLLPILGDQYGASLEAGRLRLAYEYGAFSVYHYDTQLPISPKTYNHLLAFHFKEMATELGSGHEHVIELESILTAIGNLPVATETSRERNREKELIKRRIASLHASSLTFQTAIEHTLATFNGQVGNPKSFDLLDALLDVQNFRPAHWRIAAEEINYRRFFDINDMAAIRVELPDVFEATHVQVLRLIREGRISGCRIDHPDGLWNPRTYLRRLQLASLVQRVQAIAPPGKQIDRVMVEAAWRVAIHDRYGERPLYVAAEKILIGDEQLPSDWRVDGTTGYDFLNDVNGLLVAQGSRRTFDRLYSTFIGRSVQFPDLLNSTKKMIMLVSLVSEVNSLGTRLMRIAQSSRRYRDFTLNSLTFALREVIAELPVYRTYIGASGVVSPRDRAWILAAIKGAKRRNPRTATAVFDFLRDILLLENQDDFQDIDRIKLIEFVMRVQQVTGPVMAKGAEDTAFYVYNRLASLNEVGGDPDTFGISSVRFHARNSERAISWPHAVLTTSTHDTKRSEDVRARISVLSEIPTKWRNAIARWSQMNADKKTNVDGEPAPSANDEYLLYQTLLGIWPFDVESNTARDSLIQRVCAYMEKATKEAKVRTTWVNPNTSYDDAMRAFVEKVLGDDPTSPFLVDFQAFQSQIAYFGALNSLTQTVLKLTAPGVPELYQGTEMWDLSLVDPDNRRPVDFDRRAMLLSELRAAIRAENADLGQLCRQLMDTYQDGRIKLYLTHAVLEFRRQHERLFDSGDYLPLNTERQAAANVVAFARTNENEVTITVAPREMHRLLKGAERAPVGEDVWGDTFLAVPFEWVGHTFRDVLTGADARVIDVDGTARIQLSGILRDFPVSLLTRVP